MELTDMRSSGLDPMFGLSMMSDTLVSVARS